MATTLFMITRDPFQKWKHTTKVLPRAKRIGMEVVVALDDQTSVEDAARIGAMADQVLPWKSQGHCEDAYALVPQCSGDFVFLVSDDEEPSDLCWRIAAEPPYPARYGIPVIPILGRKMWRPDIGIQERLFVKKDWAWHGGFEGHSESPAKALVMGSNPGVVIWHYYLSAPREEREAKARRYATFGPGEHWARLIWEERPDELVPMGDHMTRHLPPVLH